ncbi:MAG: hypothetical protein H7281_17720 [Bacteriovorax sp.]|nr:hypothetical protein [Bacteriovorax sp.]
MKLITVLAILMISAVSFAGNASLAKEKWTCYAEGKITLGGPAGDLWETVVGRGSTDIAAADKAMQNCFSSGLQMCSVSSCYVKK